MQIISDIEQCSDEWFALRSQRMTASNAQAIAANGKGLDTYIAKLMQEYYSTSEPVRFQSKSMERGIELEPSALFAYEAETGLQVGKVAFVIHNDNVGCSPDGLASDDGLVEIKCLEDKAYFQYLLTEKIDTGYEWQMQMQMLICERDWCDYVVFNPNYKKSLIIKRVLRNNANFDKLESGFAIGIKKIQEIKGKFDNVL